MMSERVEIVPAILRQTFREIEQDWQSVAEAAAHVQLDVTDGVFAGEGTFRDVARFAALGDPAKMELHLMVSNPAAYAEATVTLLPARCVFHVEAFASDEAVQSVYAQLRSSGIAAALAINPDTPLERLEAHLALLDYVLFMGYDPGIANRPVRPAVYGKIADFHAAHPGVLIAADGHVSAETVQPYVQAGARRLCANTAIFGKGEPRENLRRLQELAEAALTEH